MVWRFLMQAWLHVSSGEITSWNPNPTPSACPRALSQVSRATNKDTGPNSALSRCDSLISMTWHSLTPGLHLAARGTVPQRSPRALPWEGTILQCQEPVTGLPPAPFSHLCTWEQSGTSVNAFCALEALEFKQPFPYGVLNLAAP